MAAEAAAAALASTSPFETGISFTQKIHSKPYPAISPSRPELSQAGRTVLVTGGSAGIGFAIARGFAQANAERIIILGRREDVVERAVSRLRDEYPKTQIIGRYSDVSDLVSTEKLWKGFEDEGIVIDVLVLNAAKISDPGPILSLGRDEVWGQYEINVRSLLDFAERFSKQNGAEDRPKFLVNLSSESVHNFRKAAPWPAYSATKNAGTLLIQLIAHDSPAEKMQIVTFHPGTVYTEAAQNANLPKEGFPYDDIELAGNYAVWAASEEARFLHGRFVWSKWDIDELRSDELKERIDKNDHFLKIGIVGLHQ
ncbi:D-erythrulose reductase [Colletotrichum chlorophyti]|uniref:D-erythrulose reductase n=1 Tax=Colletotrichum chlorophyti TaxID=708187 RepID=A0A1Q8S9E8_9PEZI|nr:D-erythrulose reductase [Colletotrichum chlorophyti]